MGESFCNAYLCDIFLNIREICTICFKGKIMIHDSNLYFVSNKKTDEAVTCHSEGALWRFSWL